MSKWRLDQQMMRRRWLLASAAAVLAVAIAAGIWQEIAWRQYTAGHDQRVAAVRVAADQKLHAVTDMASLEALSEWLAATAADSCQAPALTDLRTALFRAAAAHQDTCHHYQEKINTATQATGVFRQHLSSSQQMAAIIHSTTSRLTKIDATDYVKRHGVWGSAAAEMKQLDVEQTVTALQATQAAAMQKIAAGYQSLATANTAKDRAAFDDAADALVQAYGSLTDTAEQAEEVTKTAAQPLIEAIDTL